MSWRDRTFESGLRSRIRWFTVVLLTLLIGSWGSWAEAADKVLSWNYDDSRPVAGFKVYYGTASRAYSQRVDVGAEKTWALTGFTAGTTYYLAVTAYDAGGIESDFSEEIVYQAPALDSDGDGLSDQDETAIYHTDAQRADSDGDGVGDGDEVSQGYDPRDAASCPGRDATTSVYEDAEDGTVAGWLLYDGDPAGARISNQVDNDRGGRVIELSGIGLDHGFALSKEDLEPWHNAWETAVEWSIQVNGPFIVYLDVETTAGHRYLYYTPDDSDGLGGDEYVHHGLGSDTLMGEWFTFVRDLQADLEEAQPGVVILEVNRFLVRGSCRLDDIRLHSTLPGPMDSDGDRLSDDEETDLFGTNPNAKDSDQDGIADGRERDYWGARWNEDPDGDRRINLLDNDADNDGVRDGEEIEGGADPADPHSLPASEETVYEDAEDKTTLRWSVYDSFSGKAKIKNLYDKTSASQVIRLQGQNLDDGFALTKAGGVLWRNSTQSVISWSMQYSVPFIIYLDVETTAGHRYLYYQADDEDRLSEGEYIHHGIGSDAVNGKWRTVTRDLNQDLAEAEPGVKILEINRFLVRGSGQIDNVKLLSDWN